jgi:hypothetical protein
MNVYSNHLDLTLKTLKRFSKLIQPGNVLNIYGSNDKIKLLVPLKDVFWDGENAQKG